MPWSILVIALYLVLWPVCAVQAQPASGPAAQAKLVEAKAAFHSVTLTGFTRAKAEIKLISEVAGRCLAVKAKVGQAIGKDGMFARLDATFTKLELEANLVEQSRLKSRLAYLEKELQRTRTLVARKSQAQAKLDAQEQQTDQARHQLRALQVQEKTLRERLARHLIKAPVGWLVMERLVEPGQWVAAGAAVGRVGDFRTLLVPLALTPAEYQVLRQAKELSLKIPATGQTVSASIYRVSPAFDPATRKIKLDLAISKGLALWRGGLRAMLTLDMPDPAGAVLLPAAAVGERYQEHWLIRADGSKVRVVVLGPGPQPGTLRVSSPEVRPGQRFRLFSP